MLKIVIFGYGFKGVQLLRKLSDNNEYEVIAFADNSVYKQGNYAGEYPILSMDDLVTMKMSIDFSVIIAANRWFEIGEQLEKRDIAIGGVYADGEIIKYDRMDFGRLDLTKEINLYASDICDEVHFSNPNLFGLSINKADSRHILHNITDKYPLPDNSISSYQAEDVLEHIEFAQLTDAINEIYRILKKDGLFRICLPDYFSPYLKNISMTNKNGDIVFDPTGGGVYGENGVSGGGHVWFPNYLLVDDLLKGTLFHRIDFRCYHTENGEVLKKEIDFSKGYINRMPKEGKIGLIYSIVVDCYK